MDRGVDSLKEITLDSSDIKEIPESIGQLKNLETIEPAHNKQVGETSRFDWRMYRIDEYATHISPNLQHLPPTLRVLQCDQRILLPFWDVLSKMSNLEKAVISKEKLQKPDQLSFENGEELDFGWWPNLKYLEITDGNFNLETLSA